MPGLYSKRNSEVGIQKKQKGSEGFKINPSDPFFSLVRRIYLVWVVTVSRSVSCVRGVIRCSNISVVLCQDIASQ